MKTLHIYPTARSIRHVRSLYQKHNQLLPTLMRIDEFERRAMLLGELRMVDPLQRRLLLQEAANFEGFEQLKINRELVRFFTKSDAIFKFFEELSHEMVGFDDLVMGDAYAEFGEHIDILQQLLQSYREILEARGLTDRVFLPEVYELNQAFADRYDRFELHLEGYMSRFELALLAQIAQQKPFVVHMQTSKFNHKVQERFLEMGIGLPMDRSVVFDLHTKRILSSQPVNEKISATVWQVEERLQQIPLLFEAVQSMVDEGIDPDQIVVILPDESFKETLKLYDHLNNLNFAMGFEYAKGRTYKRLDAIYHYWQHFTRESMVLLDHYGVEREYLGELSAKQMVKVEEFFSLMEPFGLDLDRSIVEESQASFLRVFASERLRLSTWLFLWLKELRSLTLDDVRGGKVTVMGALETRGVSYRGVVVVDFNDGVVPAIPAKDAFLNSSLRQFANLPTKNDREALQKQLYKRILEQAERATIIYALSNNRMPAGYLYELGLGLGEPWEPDMRLLYGQTHRMRSMPDPVLHDFDAQTITWSATRLNIFLSCKRKYYYQYVQQLHAPSSERLQEGRFLHTLLDQLFKGHERFDAYGVMKARLDRLMDELLVDQRPKTTYLKLLWRAKLERFIHAQLAHFKRGWRVVERERHILGEIEGIRFKGIVDRLDQNNTQTLVLDYKSGSLSGANRTQNLDTMTDFQMSIYARLLQPHFKNLELGFVEILNGGEVVPVRALEAKSQRLDEVIRMLLRTKEVIATRCEEVSRCQDCDYRLLCERGEYL